MSQQAEAAAQRKHERVTLRETIHVIDVVNGCSAGEVVNITIEGLMLSGETPLEPRSIYQLALSLPQPIGEHKVINIGADCLWSKASEAGDRFWAGLQIIDASETAEDLITQLIAAHGQRS